MAAISLNLLVISVGDLHRSVEFYQTLGLYFVAEKHGKGPEHFAAELGGAIFEIYPRQALAESAGPARIGFRVESVDEAVCKLRSIGARILTEPQDSKWGRRAVVCDPDGHRVELSQRAMSPLEHAEPASMRD